MGELDRGEQVGCATGTHVRTLGREDISEATERVEGGMDRKNEKGDKLTLSDCADSRGIGSWMLCCG